VDGAINVVLGAVADSIAYRATGPGGLGREVKSAQDLWVACTHLVVFGSLHASLSSLTTKRRGREKDESQEADKITGRKHGASRSRGKNVKEREVALERRECNWVLQDRESYPP